MEAPSPTGNATILLGAADPALAAALTAQLPQGTALETCGDGFALLEWLGDSTPRLVVLAADLPQLSGFQLCQICKLHPALESIPVLLLTSQTNRLTEFWSAALAVDGVFPYTAPADLDSWAFRHLLESLLDRPARPALSTEARATLHTELAPARLLPWIGQSLREALVERAILSAMANASTKLHDLPVLLREILVLCADLLEFSLAGVYLYSTRTLYTLQSEHRCLPAEVEEFQRAMQIQAEIFHAEREFTGGLRVESLGSFPDGETAPPREDVTFFAVPLLGEGVPLGVVGINTHKTFSRRDYYLKTLGLLAQQMALVLGGALLYQRVEELSRTDELTRLLNRRAFFERAEEEVLRARRYGRPFTIVALDLDKFKAVNDTYSHKQGDVVLRETAAIFKQVVRAIDHTGRLGGEEFVLFLPETPLEGGRIVAERVRQTLANHEFTPVCGTPPLRCTVSIGIAAYSGQGDVSLDTLMVRADDALYHAKNTGRNQVAVDGEFEKVPSPVE